MLPQESKLQTVRNNQTDYIILKAEQTRLADWGSWERGVEDESTVFDMSSSRIELVFDEMGKTGGEAASG